MHSNRHIWWCLFSSILVALWCTYHLDVFATLCGNFYKFESQTSKQQQWIFSNIDQYDTITFILCTMHGNHSDNHDYIDYLGCVVHWRFIFHNLHLLYNIMCNCIVIITTTITLNVETGDKSGETAKNNSNSKQSTVIILNKTIAIWYRALITIEWFWHFVILLSMWHLDN